MHQAAHDDPGPDAGADAVEQERLRKFGKYRVTVEPFGFLFAIGMTIQIVVAQNLQLYKVCSVNFQINATICESRLHNITDDEGGMIGGTGDSNKLVNRMQGYVTELHIYSSLVEHIPSVFFVLFLGPISDRFGRKILMGIPIIGHMLKTLTSMAVYYSPSLPVEYLVLASLPSGLLGGMITLQMGMNNYIADITTKEKRTTRMVLIAGTTSLAMPIGQAISVPLYAKASYLGIWLTSLSLFTVALLYLIFLVPESRIKVAAVEIEAGNNKAMIDKMLVDPENPTKTGPIRALVLKESCLSVFKNLWLCFQVTFKKREGYITTNVSLLLCCICVHLFSMSEHGVMYLYTRKQLGWDQPQFASYSAVFTACQVVGVVVVLPILTGLLKIPDGAIGMISLVGNISSYLCIAFATTATTMYLSCIGHVLTSGIMIAVRSMLSKLVPREELSKVYSVAACLESIMPLIASPTFNGLYKSTLETFPAAVHLLEVSLEVLLMVFFVLVLYFQWKGKYYLNKIRPASKCQKNEQVVLEDVCDH